MVLVLVLALAGCGDADPPTTAPTPTAPPLALNGAYSGDGGSFLGISRMRWVLSQSGNAVTGPVTATDAQGAITARGTLVGTLRESTFSFTINHAAGRPFRPATLLG